MNKKSIDMRYMNQVQKMKQMQTVIITILLVCLSLITVAAADPTMSVSQQPGNLGLNDTFTAEVTVDPAGGEIYAASYDLEFDETILEATEQTQGVFLSQGGVDTLKIVNKYNNTIGKITYVETRTGSEETVGGATEPGVLASVTFKVIGTGISDLTLTKIQFDDLTAEPEPTSTPESTDTAKKSSSSGGSSRYISTTTPTATPSETTPPGSSASPGGGSNAIEDSDTLQPSGENDSAGSTESGTPGFAAALAIIGLLAVVIILKPRGE